MSVIIRSFVQERERETILLLLIFKRGKLDYQYFILPKKRKRNWQITFYYILFCISSNVTFIYSVNV